MKPIIILVFTTLLFLSGFWILSFKSQNPISTRNELTLHKVATYTFPQPIKEATPLYVQYIEADNDSSLFYTYLVPNSGYPNKRGMCIYDYKTRKIRKNIPFPKTLTNYTIFSVKYICADSILIQTAASLGKDFIADSTLFLMNEEGDIKQIYNMDNTPNKTHKNDIPLENVSFPMNTHTLGEMAYSKGNIFLEGRFGVIGLDSSLKHKAQIGVYNISAQSYKELPIYHYPTQVYDNFWGDQHIDGHPITGLSGQLLLNFGYSPYILEFNEKTNEVNRHFAPSALIDTIMPLAKKWDGNAEKAMKYALSVGNYNCLMVDKYRERYARWMYLPRKNQGTIEEQNEWRWGLMLLDKEFKVLGETEITKEKIKIMGFCREGLMTIRENIHFIDSVTFTIYDVQPNVSTPKVIAKERLVITQKQDFAQYLSNTFSEIPKNEETLIIPVPMGMSCSPCVNEVLTYLASQKSNPKYKQVFPIIVFENEYAANQYLANNPIITQLSNAKIDKKGILYHYIVSFWNPKLYWMKNGKIKKQMNVQPDNLMEIKMTIHNFIRS